MRTVRVVEAVLCDLQARHWPPADDVLLHDLLDIGRQDVAVPNGLGIHHDGWAVLALVEAPRLVSTHGGTCRGLAQAGLEGTLQLAGAGGIATAAGMGFVSLVAADEDVPGEFCHSDGWFLSVGKRKKTGRTRRPAGAERSMLQGRLDLEAPGLQKALRDVLRVLVLARPLAQPC